MIGEAIKQAAIDTWDEMLYLVLFNVVWIIGAVLVIPLPFVTFGLFFTAYDITEGKSIKINTFFSHGRQRLKEAYIWGGVNLVIYVVLLLNISFYANIEAQWAVTLRLLMLSITFFWTLFQLVALALYPRLETPGLKIAYRNTMVLLGHYPIPVLVIVLFIIFLGIVASFLPATLFLLSIAFTAVFTSRMVKSMIEAELKRME